MPVSVLICCREDLKEELRRTVLWREDVERYTASNPGDVRMLVLAAQPQVVVVDLEMPGAAELLSSLRRDPGPRPLAVVVLTSSALPLSHDPRFERSTAFLPFPPGPGWDDSLLELLPIPRRRQARYAVAFDVQTWRRRDASSVVARALDLSLGGLLVSCGLQLALGDDLDFRFLIPTSDEPILGSGRVVRHEEPLRYGLRFQDIAGDGSQRLQAFLGGSA
jgi:CheY-like chemotaxis protein